MKKTLLFLLLFLSSFVQAWAIAPGDVPTAEACSIKLVNDTQAMLQYSQLVKALQRANWAFTLAVSTTPVPVPQVIQDEIVAKWQALKQNAINSFNTCP